MLGVQAKTKGKAFNTLYFVSFSIILPLRVCLPLTTKIHGRNRLNNKENSNTLSCIFPHIKTNTETPQLGGTGSHHVAPEER